MNAQKKRWDITIKYGWWLINDVLIDLLRFNFYITERSYTQGPVVTFYSVKIWKYIIETYLKQNKGMFQPISKAILWNKKQNSDLGVGFLRFVPKPSSLRPIINLSRNSIIYDPKSPGVKKELKAPNKRLQQLFSILTHQVDAYKLSQRRVDILGSSVFFVREYYNHWVLFAKKYKSNYGDPNDINNANCPKIYCIC